MAGYPWNAGDQLNAADLNAVAQGNQLPSIAGQSLTAGKPVCLLPFSSVQPTLDTKLTGTSASGTVTQAFTVAANSNRALIVAVNMNAATSGDINTMQYAGVSMTKIFTAASGASVGNRIELWYLNAPTTGTNNLVITFTTTTSINYNIYSYYNILQSGQPEVQNSVTGIATTLTNNINPLSNGALVFGCASASPSGGMFANNAATNTNIWTGDSGPVYPQSQQTGSATVGGNGAVMAIVLAPASVSVTPRVYLTSTAQAATCASYIGVTQGTASVGGAISVLTTGLDLHQSGLLIGAQYYLTDSPGTIGLVAGTVTRKAGIAVDGTKLVITNDW